MKSSRTDPEIHPTRFVIASDDIRLNVYDKLQEMRDKKHNAAYCKAMLKHWGGVMPRHVTRVEYQIRKEWLFALGLDTVDKVLSRLDEVVVHITSEGPYPFVRLTNKPPDKKNGNQSRTKTDSVWEGMMSAMREDVSDIMSPPAPTKKRKPRP